MTEELGFVISNEPDDESAPNASIAYDTIDREPKKKSKKSNDVTEEAEKRLEAFLFGKTSHEKDVDKDDDDVHIEQEANQVIKQEKLKPAWRDEDDEDILVKDVTATYRRVPGQHGSKETSTETYAVDRRRRFQNVHGQTPKWARIETDEAKIKLKGEEDSSDDDEEAFLKETTTLLEGSSKAFNQAIKPSRLQFKRVRDVNHSSYREGPIITSLQFHPKAAVALVGGLGGTLSAFQVDGDENRRVGTAHFQNFPIKCAKFANQGDEIVLGSQKQGYLNVLDVHTWSSYPVSLMQSKSGREMFEGQSNAQRFEISDDYIIIYGRFGQMHFMSAKHKQRRLFGLKMNHEVTSIAFDACDSNKVFSHGLGGEVYVWDIRMRASLHKFVDEGCVAAPNPGQKGHFATDAGPTLALSSDARYLATGSPAGVVNLYSRHELSSKQPQPLKSFLNLTTPITGLKFNPSNELLAVASDCKENAVKLVHLDALSVFENFPRVDANLRRIKALDFSTHRGGYLALANNVGAAQLFRLRHYRGY